MPSVVVAVVGSPEIAKDLGKKGTASDVTLFNAVHDDHRATFVEPTRFPERFPPLLQSLAMADQCLLVVTELNRAVAETIATADLYDLPTTLVLGPAVGEGEVGRLLKGTRFESAPRLPLDFPHLRSLTESWSAPQVDGPVRVPLDHAFAVKGVGTVALGVVRRGTLKAHERLTLFPTGKSVELRSIQVHDVDVPEAPCGERVGVALKGADPDELGRGQVLAPAGSLREGTVLRGTQFRRCPYYRGDFREGARLHLSIGLDVVPVSIGPVAGDSVDVTADRAVAFDPGAAAQVVELSVPAGPRIVGRLSINLAS